MRKQAPVYSSNIRQNRQIQRRQNLKHVQAASTGWGGSSRFTSPLRSTMNPNARKPLSRSSPSPNTTTTTTTKSTIHKSEQDDIDSTSSSQKSDIQKIIEKDGKTIAELLKPIDNTKFYKESEDILKVANSILEEADRAKNKVKEESNDLFSSEDEEIIDTSIAEVGYNSNSDEDQSVEIRDYEYYEREKNKVLEKGRKNKYPETIDFDKLKARVGHLMSDIIDILQGKSMSTYQNRVYQTLCKYLSNTLYTRKMKNRSNTLRLEMFNKAQETNESPSKEQTSDFEQFFNNDEVREEYEKQLNELNKADPIPKFYTNMDLAVEFQHKRPLTILEVVSLELEADHGYFGPKGNRVISDAATPRLRNILSEIIENSSLTEDTHISTKAIQVAVGSDSKLKKASNSVSMNSLNSDNSSVDMTSSSEPRFLWWLRIFGMINYIDYVIIPEIMSRLIMEDFNVEYNQARVILSQSSTYGNIMFPIKINGNEKDFKSIIMDNKTPKKHLLKEKQKSTPKETIKKNGKKIMGKFKSFFSPKKSKEASNLSESKPLSDLSMPIPSSPVTITDNDLSQKSNKNLSVVSSLTRSPSPNKIKADSSSSIGSTNLEPFSYENPSFMNEKPETNHDLFSSTNSSQKDSASTHRKRRKIRPLKDGSVRYTSSLESSQDTNETGDIVSELPLSSREPSEEPTYRKISIQKVRNKPKLSGIFDDLSDLENGPKRKPSNEPYDELIEMQKKRIKEQLFDREDSDVSLTPQVNTLLDDSDDEEFNTTLTKSNKNTNKNATMLTQTEAPKPPKKVAKPENQTNLFSYLNNNKTKKLEATKSKPTSNKSMSTNDISKFLESSDEEPAVKAPAPSRPKKRVLSGSHKGSLMEAINSSDEDEVLSFGDKKRPLRHRLTRSSPSSKAGLVIPTYRIPKKRAKIDDSKNQHEEEKENNKSLQTLSSPLFNSSSDDDDETLNLGGNRSAKNKRLSPTLSPPKRAPINNKYLFGDDDEF